MLPEAYQKGFSPSNIASGFERADISPFNPLKLLGQPLPDSSATDEPIITSEQQMASLEQRCIELRYHIVGYDEIVSH